jgi:hypothetical protein
MEEEQPRGHPSGRCWSYLGVILKRLQCNDWKREGERREKRIIIKTKKSYHVAKFLMMLCYQSIKVCVCFFFFFFFFFEGNL